MQIPFNAFENQFGTRWRDVSVRAKIQSSFAMVDAKDEIRGVLRIARSLDVSEEDNF